MKVFQLLLSAAVVYCAISPIQTVGLGGLALQAILPKTSERGVVKTAPPENGVKKIEFSKPIYKDYYKKTEVDIRPVVQSTLYDESEFSVVLNDTHEFGEIDRAVHLNSSAVFLQPSPVMTSTSMFKYDQFDWATETQMYTTALNVTTTVVVENPLPML